MHKNRLALLFASIFLIAWIIPIQAELICTPSGETLCGSCPQNTCNDYCDGTENPKTSRVSTTYYQTTDFLNPSISQPYGSGTYLETTKTFHDETFSCATGDCCESGQFGCTANYHYQDCSCQNIACKEWQTCSVEGTADQKKGCTCDPTYCQGWCMDNAPVYDGLASCEVGTINTGAFKDSICEQYLNGKCDSTSSGKKIIYSLTPASLSLCTLGIGCSVDQSKTCASYAGECKDNGVIYSPTCKLTTNGDTGWMIQIPEGGCSSGQSCCIPLKTVTDPNLLANPKYTLVPDEHKATTGLSCYCNYLAIKNYYECSDTKIQDSHPCLSNNCASDFVGGQSYCCPTGYCSHVNDLTKPVLCKSKEGKDFVSCDNNLAPDQTKNPNVMCIKSEDEITYEGMRLTCNSGQWRNSQSCGETLFNYPLNSNADPQVSDKLLTDSTYGFKNSPIAFELDFKTPKTAVAYIIPKSKTAGSVEINAIDLAVKDPKETEAKEEIKGDGTKRLLLENLVGNYQILFKGGSKKDLYNISVDCYTPDKSYCNVLKPDCTPESYCVEDSPQNNANTNKKYCQQYTNPAKPTEKINIPQDQTQNCFYCCPKGYCAHKVGAASGSVINSKLEAMAPLKKDEETKIIMKDDKGAEIPNNKVSFELDETSKSICELDPGGVVKIAGGLLIASLAKESYDFVCKIKISYNEKQNSFWINMPVHISALGIDKTIDPLGSVKDFLTKKVPAEIRPLAYNPWSVGAKKEFLFYDSSGDRISSGIKWCVGDTTICATESDNCKLSATPDFGSFEARGKGVCMISANFNGEIAKLTENIIDPSPESNVQVYVEKSITSSDDYTVECYPPGTHKLDTCNWICMDGVWGKGMAGQPCENDCDCNLGSETAEDTLKCVPIKEGEIKGTCCKAGQCASENSCVDEGDKKMVGGVLSECSKGNWEQSGLKIVSNYQRTVLSSNNPTKSVSLQVTKSDLNTDKNVKTTVHTFFEKGSYNGNIEIYTINDKGEKIKELYNGVVDEDIPLSLPSEDFGTIPLLYQVTIKLTPSSPSDYLTYIGSSLVAEIQD